MTQPYLPIFAPEGKETVHDERPLPLIVAEKWGFDLAYVDQNSNPKHYLYAGQDWYKGLGGSRQGWSKLNNQLSTSSRQLPYVASDGKTYQIDFVPQDDLYRIANAMRLTKKRPILAAVIEYLVQSGVKLDEYRRNPEQMIADGQDGAVSKYVAQGKDESWAVRRVTGMTKRKWIGDVAKETHVAHDPNYGALTNATYKPLFSATKAELVKALNLTDAQVRKFRDQLGELAIAAIDAAETAAAIKMQMLGRGLTDDEQLAITRECAAIVAPGFWSLADYTGTDFVSGRPVLGTGKHAKQMQEAA